MYHYYTYDGRTLCSAGALPYPEISALPETGEGLWVFHRPPLAGRDTFPVTDPAQLTEEEGVASLCTAPCPEDVPPALLSAIRAGRRTGPTPGLRSCWLLCPGRKRSG